MKLLLRVIPRPNETNNTGDIFGGWLMSQIDLAGAVLGIEYTEGPIVTVAVKDLTFLKPIYVYDLVSFYGEITHVGKSSLTIHIEAYAQRRNVFHSGTLKVSDAILVYVAVEKPGVKRLISKRD
ncbi:MAG: acyl-CoA thioesterase [Gammaproteobacteria bacterium RIFCSPLOWO2_02_FULL_38_11]|nr:MAG: acyl-CoA thioesterase [Gammaproteobacteria bacterium RIFCSPHIGHO2_02_FULL_38_33]OGT24191.1 MAG: acyl-CoA thioesterase [Gammaproteobacteria bacterium RIFCSPHIGHO2_12_38_15]OGT69648.1 MAG: acyl-CoA thioesterase [Gammaproteobacteria bacterium RIFCSPLOWO2_02_FULL_38_11]OGT75498.1 MAG: acyl-CoA thioesterase [Gammaproteobacteria bacterium RIFCSPLOWO2_12_FULL_38_14]